MKNRWYKDPRFNTDDLGFFYSRLAIAAARFDLTTVNLGCVHGYPLLYYYYPKDKGPKVLIAAGFHGEEQAGPWALLRFLEIVPAELMLRVNVGFLPLVNPTGFMRRQRFNLDGVSPNSGFIPSLGDSLSVEGKCLVKNRGLFWNQAANGFLSLHEQTHAKNFYTYALESGDKPSERAMKIRDAGSSKFPVIEDGPIPAPGSGEVKDGIVMNQRDGTFEDMLFGDGVPCCYTTETPVSGNFSRRVRANLLVMKAFVTSAC